METGFFKIYNSSRLELQKEVYKRYIYSIFYTPSDDNYIPAWYFEEADEIDTIEVQHLNTVKLNNEVIESFQDDLIYDSASPGGYDYTQYLGWNSTKEINYADKGDTSEFLPDGGIYRLKLIVQTTANTYYSEIFKKIQP